jgi:hypothetical protein
MRRSLLVAPLLSAALALPVLAQADRDVKTGGTGQETTLKLMINAGMDLALVYEGGEFREVAHWSNGGLAATSNSRDPYYFFNGPVWVQFWASLQDNIDLTVTLRNVPFNNNTSVQEAAGGNPHLDRNNWGAASNMQVSIKYANVKIREFFHQAVTLSLGLMDVIWDLRGKGNAVFLDVAHSESPWGEIDRAWATTVRTEEYPVGMKVTFSPTDQYMAEMGWFPVIHEAQTRFGISNGADQEAIYYLSGTAKFAPKWNGKVGAIVALFHGTNPADNVFTFGGGLVLQPMPELEIFGEGYYQEGQAWSERHAAGDLSRTSLGGVAFVDDGEHTSLMLLVGAHLDIPAGDMPIWAEAHFLYAEGHDMGPATEFSRNTGFALGAADNDLSGEFMSYENYDVMAILNSNEWGYDFDNNIIQFTGMVGTMMSAGGSMPNNLHLTLKLAYATPQEEWRVNAVPGIHGANDPKVYGFEIDICGRWYVNKNVNFYMTFAYLTGSEVLEMFNRETDDYAWLWMFGTQVSN